MKNWKSLNEFFRILNENTNYLVLRNYEDFEDGLIVVQHPDIDILCSDRDNLLKYACSESRVNKSDKIHRHILIEGKLVDLDIRHVGDGYYDARWEQKMLGNKILYNGMCYVMDPENYYYSLLYHALIQKKVISNDYKKRLAGMASELDFSIKSPLSISTLESYMKRKGYKYTYPINPRGIVNFTHVDKNLIEMNLYRQLMRTLYYLKRKIVNIIKK